tara:strand:+ start:2154 stop:3044 length:891 start_codon:yes stop_codon:yes gene_type:complete
VALELTDPENLLISAKTGNRRSLSRLLSVIESGVYPNLISTTSWTIGITGPPGVGKSTLIGRMIDHWVSEGENIAVLAFDPNSPISGGSFLADRLRINQDCNDNVFVRSFASGTNFGVSSPQIEKMCLALSECGWTRIVIETVGTGQSEVRIVAVADRVLLVDGPDRGDIIQAEKAGILELADFIVINKSDLPGAESAANNIRMSLDLTDGESREVHLVSAMNDIGIERLMEEIKSFKPNDDRNKLRMTERLRSMWDSKLVFHNQIEHIIQQLCDGSLTLTEAIAQVGQSTDFGGE